MFDYQSDNSVEFQFGMSSGLIRSPVWPSWRSTLCASTTESTPFATKYATSLGSNHSSTAVSRQALNADTWQSGIKTTETSGQPFVDREQQWSRNNTSPEELLQELHLQTDVGLMCSERD